MVLESKSKLDQGGPEMTDFIAFGVTAVALVVLVALAIAIAKAFSRNSVVGGIVGFAVFLAAILLLSMGSLDTPVTNWVSEGVSSLAGLVSASDSTSVANPDINIHVEPSPATVIVREVGLAEDVESTASISESAGEEAIESEGSSIFDLGQIEPDGEFEDGIGYFLYEIQRGDTIYNLSRRFNVTQSDLRDRNGLRVADPIRIGRDLKIPIN